MMRVGVGAGVGVGVGVLGVDVPLEPLLQAPRPKTSAFADRSTARVDAR
jgi:hypothetical protein